MIDNFKVDGCCLSWATEEGRKYANGWLEFLAILLDPLQANEQDETGT
jgi:hypothetical protein